MTSPSKHVAGSWYNNKNKLNVTLVYLRHSTTSRLLYSAGQYMPCFHDIRTTITFFIKAYQKKKIDVLRGKNGSTEHSKGNKTVPGKVATTHTEDGHK
jgi:hypothetical protein